MASEGAEWQGQSVMTCNFVQSVRPDIVTVQLGTTDLSFRAPLLVGSDPEDFVRLLRASYGVQFVYAKLFVVVRRCRSTKTLPF